LIDIAVKDWPGCRIAHPGRIGSVCQHPRLRSWRLNGCAGTLDGQADLGLRPTDAKLVNRARETLVTLAKKLGVERLR
jgi:hypothetical protein